MGIAGGDSGDGVTRDASSVNGPPRPGERPQRFDPPRGLPSGDISEWAEWAAADPTVPRLPALPAKGQRTRDAGAFASDWRERLRSLAERHGMTLLSLTGLMFLAQAIFFSSAPVTPPAPDSTQYLARAVSLAHGGPFADPLRVPGYPLLLAAIFAFTGGQNIGAVIAVQTALTVLTAYGVYLLAWRLSRRRWLAFICAALTGANLYVIDWQASIRDESFSTFLLVALLLVFERIVAKDGGAEGDVPARSRLPVAVAGFAALSLALILTRPFFLYLPAALVVGLLALRLRDRVGLRRLAVGLTLAVALVYAGVAGYAALNEVENGYFGLSWAGPLNLFGIVQERHLDTLPVTPEYQPVQRDLRAWEAAGNEINPGDFGDRYGYTPDYYGTLTGYGSYIVRHYPAQYTVAALRETPAVIKLEPVLYTPFNTPNRLPHAFNAMRRAGWAALLSYRALPLVALWLIYRLWRAPEDRRTQTLALLLFIVIGAIAMSIVGSFGEYYRLRFPVDFAYLTVVTLSLWDVALALLRRGAPLAARLWRQYF